MNRKLLLGVPLGLLVTVFGWLVNRKPVERQVTLAPEVVQSEVAVARTDGESVANLAPNGSNGWACNADARLYCPDEFARSDVGRKVALVSCLATVTTLTPECAAQQAGMRTATEKVNEVCATARGALCPGVTPDLGSAYGNDCLMEHEAELATAYDACLSALQEQRGWMP